MKPTILNNRIIGVDLGNSFTKAAFIDGSGSPRAFPNRDGTMVTPSVVYVSLGGKEILVGQAALNMAQIEPERVFANFKRYVGTDHIFGKAGDIEITATWLQAQVLSYILESARERFGDPQAGSRVVVTVPANFNERQRQSVCESAKMAGTTVDDFINEPTAACLAHGLAQKPGDSLSLIVDKGGSSTDTSLVQYQGGVATVLASEGSNELGGQDVDKLLMGLLQEEFRSQHGLEFTAKSHPGEFFRAEEEVIRVKQSLSSRREARLTAQANGLVVAITITREQFADLLAPMMARIKELILKTLAAAKVDVSDINQVVKVGGSSRILPFRDLLNEIFGEKTVVGGDISPDFCVAEGAAIHAIKLATAQGATVVDEELQAIPAPAISHADVMPHSVGIAVQDKAGGKLRCCAILFKNGPMPGQAVRRFASVTDDQRHFRVVILQGEDKQLLEECLVVAEKEIQFKPRSHKQPSLEITLAYDRSSMVHVVVHDLVGGLKEDITTKFFGNGN